MNIYDILPILQCIHCSSTEIEFQDFNQTVPFETGILKCKQCRRYFPIKDFIIDYLPDDLVDKKARLDFESRYAKFFTGSSLLFSEILKIKNREHLHQFTFEEECGELYHQDVVLSAFWNKVTSVVFQRWLDFINNAPHGIVLDVGSGTGRVAHFFAKTGRRVVGIDVMIPLLTYAQRKAREDKIDDRICYMAADIWHLPFRDRSIGILTFFGVLHHLGSPYDALEHLIETLDENAVIFGLENNKTMLRYLFDCLMKLWPIWTEDSNLKHPTISWNRISKIIHHHGFSSSEMNTTCFLPPHLYQLLPTNYANFTYNFVDHLFSNIPYLKHHGGLIHFQAKRILGTPTLCKV